MMNGRSFIETLKKIGYYEELNGDHFDWMFDNDNLRGFLNWFCSEVSELNVVDPLEVETFKRLESDGVVLGLDDLNKLLVHEDPSNDDDDDDDDDDENISKDFRSRSEYLLNRIESSKNILHAKKRKKDLMSRQHKILTKQLESLKSQNSEKLVESFKQGCAASFTNLKTEDDELSLMLVELSSRIEAILKCYDGFKQVVCEDGVDVVQRVSNIPDVHPWFTSLQDLAPYFKCSEEFVRLVEEHFKMSFQWCEDGGGDDDQNKCNENENIVSVVRPLSLSDLTNLQHDGDDEGGDDGGGDDEAGDQVSPLTRLMNDMNLIQQTIPSIESTYINANINKNKVSTERDFLNKYINTINSSSAYINNDDDNISHHRQNIKLMSEAISKISTLEIPNLLSRIAEQKVLEVVGGSYDEKLHQQYEVLAMQDATIDHLIICKSINELVSSILNVEYTGHKHTRDVLEAVVLLCEEVSLGSVGRQARLKKISSSTSSSTSSTTTSSSTSVGIQPHNIIPSTESYISTINNMMNINNIQHNNDLDDVKLFMLSSELLHRMRSLVNCKMDCESSDALNRCLSHKNILSLSRQVQESTQLFPLDPPNFNNVIGQKFEIDHALNLLPQPIVDKMTELDELLQKVKLTFTDVIQNLEEKKKTLKADEMCAYERHLFVDFLTNEDRMKRKVNEINDRVNLLQ